jgi:hypothetical protein
MIYTPQTLIATPDSASYLTPVLYYTMENGSGTTVTDRSDRGNSLDASLFNTSAAVWDSDVPTNGGSYSLLIDGSNDYGQTSNSSLIGTVGADYSVSCYLKLPNPTGSFPYAYAWNLYDTGGTNIAWGSAYANGFSGTGWNIQGYHEGSHYAANIIGTTTNPGDFAYGSGWHHIVWTMESATKTLSIYIDGGLAHSGIPNIGNPRTATNVSFQLGRLSTQASYEAHYMDEVALWDVTLDPSQVTAIHNGGVVTDLNQTLTL